MVCKGEMAWIDTGREREKEKRRERGKEKEKKERGRERDRLIEKLIDGSDVAVKMTVTEVNQGIFMANREGQLIDLDLWLGARFILCKLSILSLSLSRTHPHTPLTAHTCCLVTGQGRSALSHFITPSGQGLHQPY